MKPKLVEKVREELLCRGWRNVRSQEDGFQLWEDMDGNRLTLPSGYGEVSSAVIVQASKVAGLDPRAGG